MPAPLESAPATLPGVPWYGRIRWQVALSYFLGAVVSVVLVAAFATIMVSMVVSRGSINTVERQVDLAVQMLDSRAGLVSQFVLLQAQNPQPPPRPRPRGAAPPPARPRGEQMEGIRSRVVCTTAGGSTTELFFPSSQKLEIPGWLNDDRFASVTFEESSAVIRAFRRTKSDSCTSEVFVESPVSERLRDEISRASGLTIDLFALRRPAAPKTGTAPEKKGPPSIAEMALRSLLSSDRGSAALIGGVRWLDGQPARRPLFRVHPDAATAWSQLTQFGDQPRPWVWGLALLASGFFLVEILAVIIAMRVVRRIVAAVDDLTLAAARVGDGDLSHRVAVTRNDQLGHLGEVFNHMTESIQRLLAETKEKQRLEEEVRIARQVQESLLPSELPQLSRGRLAAVCLPARNVSGDLYDVIPLGPDRIGLLCADVSGKGIPAALLSANIQALVRVMLRGESGGDAPSPGLLLERINSELVRRIPSNAFVTLFWAEYDAKTRLLRWANAGHCAPLLVCGGQTQWLNESGLPAGMFGETQYSDQERILPEGALLVAYTDGVVEAERFDGEAFGEERLIALCSSDTGKDPAPLVKRIVDSVQKWTGEPEPGDDLTLLALRT